MKGSWVFKIKDKHFSSWCIKYDIITAILLYIRCNGMHDVQLNTHFLIPNFSVAVAPYCKIYVTNYKQLITGASQYMDNVRYSWSKYSFADT